MLRSLAIRTCSYCKFRFNRACFAAESLKLVYKVVYYGKWMKITISNGTKYKMVNNKTTHKKNLSRVYTTFYHFPPSYPYNAWSLYNATGMARWLFTCNRTGTKKHLSSWSNPNKSYYTIRTNTSTIFRFSSFRENPIKKNTRKKKWK